MSATVATDQQPDWAPAFHLLCRKASPSHSIAVETMNNLFREAKSRWLTPAEVVTLLQNRSVFDLPISSTITLPPESGSLLFFDKSRDHFWRRDGGNWKKKKNGRQIMETCERLKIGGMFSLKCCYTHSADRDAFQRRGYWLLQGSPIVLVHYLDVGDPGFRLVRKKCRELTPSSLLFSPGPPVSVASDQAPCPMRFIEYQPIQQQSRKDQKFCPVSSEPFDHPQAPVPNLPVTAWRLCIQEFSPSWGWIEGGTKILIILANPISLSYSEFDISCLFGQKEVNCDLVAPMVVRCVSPPVFFQQTVDLCVSIRSESGEPFEIRSDPVAFEFKARKFDEEAIFEAPSFDHKEQHHIAAELFPLSPHPYNASPFASPVGISSPGDLQVIPGTEEEQKSQQRQFLQNTIKICEEMLRSDESHEELDGAVTLIQSFFRMQRARKESLLNAKKKKTAAATKIQAAFRRHHIQRSKTRLSLSPPHSPSAYPPLSPALYFSSRGFPTQFYSSVMPDIQPLLLFPEQCSEMERFSESDLKRIVHFRLLFSTLRIQRAWRSWIQSKKEICRSSGPWMESEGPTTPQLVVPDFSPLEDQFFPFSPL